MDYPALDPLSPFRHLYTLQTPQGEREIYNAVSYCNRCGCCAQVCPSFQLHLQENFSPRGRNQLLRLALEGKIKLTAKNKVLRTAITSCLLCGRCTAACAGQVPTAELVLEMRRTLRLRVLPKPLHDSLQTRSLHPRLFSVLARAALIAKRFGAFAILPKPAWLKALGERLPKRTPALKKVLAQAGIPLTEENPQQIYLPSLEAEFILPDIARKTLVYARQKARTAVWANTPTGLFDYVYGDLRRCRRVLRRLLIRHAHTGDGNLPLITDSIDVYTYLRRAPQVFSGRKFWQKRAEKFAACVRYVTDIFPPITDEKPGPALLDLSSLLSCQEPAHTRAREILATLFGKNLVECLYTDADTPAFEYVLAAPKDAAEIGLKAVERIARTHAREVVTLSGLAALELTYLLKKFYPAAEATHFVDVDR